jgi:replicative DNA helicase
VAHTDPTTEPAALEAALHYASLGLRVIPIAPGKKHPPVPEWQKAATCDPAIIEAWWTGLYRGHGVGIATGPGSGVWVLDVDTAGAKVGAASLAELEASYGPLPATVESITGTGGRHLFFTADPAHPVRNNQSGKAGVDLDVRGDGGQVVAAPTLHPDTHVPYRWRPGRGFGEIAVAPAPPWLYGVLEREDDPPPAAPARPNLGVTTPEDDSPAAAFNASTTWDQLLTRDGWTLARTLGSGEQRWVRPGKSARDGISATVGHGRRDVLKVFTSSVPELRADEAYSRFGYEAAVRYHGDRSAFAAHLRRQMNEAAGIGQRDLSDLTDMSWLGDTVTTPALEAVEPVEGGGWPLPVSLEPAITHGVPFPVEALPPWIARQVLAVADSFQVPVDLPAMFALGVLSTVVMGHVKVRVTGTDWTEHANLYLTAALPPGAGKTPAFKAMARCVTDLEAELISEAQQTIREATIKRAVLEKQAKTAFDAAAMKSGSMDQAIQAQAEFEALEIPCPPRLLADDATPESLAVVMAEHGGRMALLSDEGDIFDIMAGQYSGAGKSTNLSPYLKGHSAGSIKQDRIGRARVSIPEALLTVCVATQPRVLAKLGENPELAGRGLSSRFMYCVPASNVGFRDRYAVLNERDSDAQLAYDDAVKDLGRNSRRYTFPVTLNLSIEARDLFLAWDQELEGELRAGASLSSVAEWAMKLRSSVLRLAALLHTADGATGDISVATMRRSLAVASYWTDHALRVHTTWGAEADSVMRRARQIIEWATKAGEEREAFTVREAYIECRNRDNTVKVDAAVESIERLIDLGWVRAEGDLATGRGRKSPTVTLHPQAAELHAHNAQPGENVSAGPECARHARCALIERYAFSSSLSTGGVDGDFSSLLTRNAHDAQLAEQPDPPSPPQPVVETEPVAEDPTAVPTAMTHDDWVASAESGAVLIHADNLVDDDLADDDEGYRLWD